MFGHEAAEKNTAAVNEYAAKTLDLGYGLTTTIMDIVGSDPPDSAVISLLADEGKYGWLFPETSRFPGAFGVCPGL